ncbi:hypothetical protein G8O24_37870 [Bradyrhizobium sp. INPA01-394B]|uniref:Uncharacterized protein n=1 Tax=Bradyrhizobium campsiandrae TaxID=1729892 RepID=A0ABR7UJE4_9BRAD|nr:hypothetical protein [Bradyrhizobium campsiandrae]MBC9883064.1 hypothetical protein [Bradyrhizobium campsiandrae]MBC9983567.1 hypothetical protein [Bradyrhizobium campsiandrae]
MVLRKLATATLAAGLYLANAAAAETVSQDPGRSPESAGIAEKARLASSWRSLDLTSRTLTAGPVPAAWDAGLFLDVGTLETSLGQIVGLKLRRSGQGLLAGTSVTVEGMRLKPDAGSLEAELDLAAEKAGFSLPLKVAANVTFQGVSKGSDGTSSLVTLRIEPTGISPHSDGSLLDIAKRSFLTAVIPDLLVLFADPHLFEARIPLPDHVEVPLGLEKTQTIPVNGGSGSVTIQTSMAKGSVAQDISYGGVVFGRKGVWLLGRLAEGAASDRVADEPPASLAELRSRVEALRASVTAELDRSKTPSGAGVHVGKSALLALTDKIRKLDPSLRRVTFKTVGKNGNLAGKRQDLGILGNLGIQASLLDAGAGSGGVGIEFGQATWSQKSLMLPLDATLDAEAKIQLNVDMIASGVVRTSVGLVGHGSGSMTAIAQPVVTGSGDRKVAAIEFPGSCSALQADVKTDGVLKGDLGWMKVPSIGGRISSSLGPIPPVLVLDGRPHLVRVAAKNFGDWSVEAPHSALAVAFAPEAFAASDDGIDLVVRLRVAPVVADGPRPDADEALDRAARTETEQVSAATKDALAQLAPAPCPASSGFALLLGDLVFGSNNEIVRLLVLLGKLPKEAWETVEHLGHEVSIDKVKGWIDDPQGSLKRGEFGKLADHVGHELSVDKGKEWIQHPADAARRGAVGRVIRGKLP